MKRPRLNRTENNKEDTAEECGNYWFEYVHGI